MEPKPISASTPEIKVLYRNKISYRSDVLRTKVNVSSGFQNGGNGSEVRIEVFLHTGGDASSEGSYKAIADLFIWPNGTEKRSKGINVFKGSYFGITGVDITTRDMVSDSLAARNKEVISEAQAMINLVDIDGKDEAIQILNYGLEPDTNLRVYDRKNASNEMYAYK